MLPQKIPQNNDRTNREKGDALESYIARALDMEPTNGSGNQKDDADLKDEHMLIECKVKGNNAGVNVPEKQLTKLIKQAAKWHRDYAFVTMNSNGKIYVTTDIQWFIEIYEAAKLHWKQKDEEERNKFRNA